MNHGKQSIQTFNLVEVQPMTGMEDKQEDMDVQQKDDSYPPGHGILKNIGPISATNTHPTIAKEKYLSFENIENFASTDNVMNSYRDGTASVSRGLQTDIRSNSVIDWVLKAQQPSSTSGE
ncbi:unnamed protein product, partial [Didymodactylos carnosus]